MRLFAVLFSGLMAAVCISCQEVKICDVHFIQSGNISHVATPASVSVVNLSNRSDKNISWTGYIINKNHLQITNETGESREADLTEHADEVRVLLENIVNATSNATFAYMEGKLMVLSTGDQHWKVGVTNDTALIYNFAGDVAAFNVRVDGVQSVFKLYNGIVVVVDDDCKVSNYPAGKVSENVQAALQKVAQEQECKKSHGDKNGPKHGPHGPHGHPHPHHHPLHPPHHDPSKGPPPPPPHHGPHGPPGPHGPHGPKGDDKSKDKNEDESKNKSDDKSSDKSAEGEKEKVNDQTDNEEK